MERQFPHAMLREIYEQPAALRATLEAYTEENGLRAELFAGARAAVTGERLLIAASGSSRHAGLVARNRFWELAGLAVDVEYASEWIYSGRAAAANMLVISQSGETADTLEALRSARGATVAITNVAGSAMDRLAGCGLVTRAGIERAVPATKSFTTQLMVLELLARFAGNASDLADLREIPGLIEGALTGWEAAIGGWAATLDSVESYLFLGRGIHLPIAAEGALKLKESAYVQAEAYPTGELKHGPAALLTDGVPLVAIATVDRASADSVLRYEKTLGLLRDMKGRGVRILALAAEGDLLIPQVAETIFVPAVSEGLLPLVEVVPLQLLAYCVAVRRGIDVDRPRGLSKAVLVE